jgi:hypothetical protein
MTKEIIKAIGRRQVLRNHTPVCENVSCIYSWEVDLFSINPGGYCYEFEVKISRQDFLKDRKKKKWAMQEWKKKTHIPNYMSYVCPKDLIKIDEIPSFSGLYYYSDSEIIEIKAPKLRHDEKSDRKEINMKLARLYSQRNFLGCSMLTHLNREIKQRNEARVKEILINQERAKQKLNDRLMLNSEQGAKECVATMQNQG